MGSNRRYEIDSVQTKDRTRLSTKEEGRKIATWVADRRYEEAIGYDERMPKGLKNGSACVADADERTMQEDVDRIDE